MNTIDQKANSVFAGKVVRKDLTSRIKGNASVPTYVLEYLLGQYCATDDEATIEDGVETVRNIISQHFVHRDEANSIKSIIREKGSHRIIDKISVRLNDKLDRYEADFSNLGLNKVPIADRFIQVFPKLLSEGVWSIITIDYFPSEGTKDLPWSVETIKPIQISDISISDFKESRSRYTKEEWIDFLIQGIGLNPEEFSLRSKLLQLTRLVPFAENNYNLIELGPKGTGKSHIYSELSPHGILISGGEVSKAKLFVNNSNGEIGLVGYWDVVAYDEFAGKTKRTDRGLVDIMKNYMANKSFSRGTNVYQAEASMVFVGNTDHSVPHMLKHSNLFDALPKDYYDTAFLDRIHCYLPGWEVKKLRNEMFTSGYGFIVDYLAEVLKVMRKEDYSRSYEQFFTLSNTITTRDKTSIEKTFSGLVKVIFPNGELNRDDAKLLLDFAIESRKRVKDQLRKMDETFNDEEVHFSYTDVNGDTTGIETLEVLEHGDPMLGIQAELFKEVQTARKEKESEKAFQLSGFHKVIRDNQSNVSYDRLFGDYLEGATEYTIRDPYIRLPYQMRNFMEFCTLIASKKPEDLELHIHLITNNNEDYIEGAKEAFKEIYESLLDLGIDFSYQFSESLHDRSIEMNNGWKIVLGRGLDIWQKTNGRYDIAEYMQEKRLCKEFEVTVLKAGE
jgi:ATP-dependent Lon protease